MRPNTVVSFRRRPGDPSRPTILLLEGWSVRSGIGMHPDAVPVRVSLEQIERRDWVSSSTSRA